MILPTSKTVLNFNKGKIEIINIVDESVASEYISIGIMDKHGISQSIKYSIT